MFRAATIPPIMADFPLERLANQSPPFTNTGVDYFGPFYVALHRNIEKRWAFLFTCLTTRAVHIEVGPSMDASSCVMGLEWFVSRRGTPAIIWSDNSTFVGAEKELRESVEKWNTTNIAAELAHKGIKWSGGSTRPVRHTKVASGRGRCVVFGKYFTAPSLLIASLTKFWTLLFTWSNTHLTHAL